MITNFGIWGFLLYAAITGLSYCSTVPAFDGGTLPL
jgi:hypothetical protein